MYNCLGQSLPLRTDIVDFILLYGTEDLLDCKENIETVGPDVQRCGTNYVHVEFLCYAMSD